MRHQRTLKPVEKPVKAQPQIEVHWHLFFGFVFLGLAFTGLLVRQTDLPEMAKFILVVVGMLLGGGLSLLVTAVVRKLFPD